MNIKKKFKDYCNRLHLTEDDPNYALVRESFMRGYGEAIKLTYLNDWHHVLVYIKYQCQHGIPLDTVLKNLGYEKNPDLLP